MPSENEVVVACAGSGKTTYLLKRALEDPTKRTLIVTYTNENLREINAGLWRESSGNHPHVDTMSIFELLLRECIKPYQTYKTGIAQVRSLNFVTPRPRYASRSDFQAYYLDDSGNVYSDEASDLAFHLNEESGGEVITRLEAIYDAICVDEMQDLAGWDLDFVDLLLHSSIDVTLVGDPRQVVYFTNQSTKNKSKKGAKIVDWIEDRVQAGVCRKLENAHSYRCVQTICNFADALFPNMTSTTSYNDERTGHDGVFLVKAGDVEAYRAAYEPQELRWDRNCKSAGASAKNFGEVKGRTFQRVLIHPTKTISRYVETGSELADATKCKFYVAITRARQSVAIVTDKTTTSTSLPIWSPKLHQEVRIDGGAGHASL